MVKASMSLTDTFREEPSEGLWDGSFLGGSVHPRMEEAQMSPVQKKIFLRMWQNGAAGERAKSSILRATGSYRQC